jgi:hypothetical protein
VTAGAASDVISPILERYVVTRFGAHNTGSGETLRVALAFDRACYACFKRSCHNNPRRFVNHDVLAAEENAFSFLATLESPLQALSVPERIADLVAPEKAPSCGWEEGIHHFLVHRHGYVKISPRLQNMVDDL